VWKSTKILFSRSENRTAFLWDVICANEPAFLAVAERLYDGSRVAFSPLNDRPNTILRRVATPETNPKTNLDSLAESNGLCGRSLCQRTARWRVLAP